MGIVAVGFNVLVGKDADDYMVGKHPLNKIEEKKEEEMPVRVDIEQFKTGEAAASLADPKKRECAQCANPMLKGIHTCEPQGVRWEDQKQALESILAHTHARNGSAEQDEEMLLAIREVAQKALGIDVDP